jgi:hypothetical protein
MVVDNKKRRPPALVAREDCFSETGAGISAPKKQKQARQPFAELTMMPLPMHGEVDFMVH